MKTLISHRLQEFDTPGSMGVVTDTRFWQCYWPPLTEPTAIFAEGSSGIRVVGSPTARNVVFPDDTVFEDFHPDALYPAELAFKQAYPGRKLLNLTDEQAALWLAAYDAEVARLDIEEPTHTIFQTPSDVMFIAVEEEIAGKTEMLVASLEAEQVEALKEDSDHSKLDLTFVRITDSVEDADVETFEYVNGAIEKTAALDDVEASLQARL